MKVITNNELANLRDLYDSLGHSIKAASGSDQPELATLLHQQQDALLFAADYAVMIPCLLCKRLWPHEVAIDERAWPHACICAECSTKVDAAIAADAALNG